MGDDTQSKIDEIAQLIKEAKKKSYFFPLVRQVDELDCGAACLEAINRFYGKRVGLGHVSDLVLVDREGASLFDISQAASVLGYKFCGIQISIDQIDLVPSPFIAHRDFHFVVVYKVARNKIYFMDPASGNECMMIDHFSREFSGNILLLGPTEKLQLAPQRKLEIRKFIAPFISDYDLLAHILVVTLFLSFLGISGPLLTQSIIDELSVSKPSMEFIFYILLGYLWIVLFGFFMNFLQQYLLIETLNKYEYKMTNSFYAKLLSLRKLFFDRKSYGDITATLNEISNLSYFFLNSILFWTLDLINILIYLAVLYFINPHLFFFAVASVPLVFITPLITSNLLQKLYNLEFRKKVQLDTVVESHIRGINTIKNFNSETSAMRQWEHSFVGYVTQRRNNILKTYPLELITNIIEIITSAGFLILGSRLVLNQNISAGTLIGSSMLFGRILSPLLSLSGAWKKIQEIIVSIDRVDSVLENQEEISISPTLYLEENKFQRLELVNASFQYHPNLNFVFKNFNFIIKSGEYIALMGPSGIGKSSISKILNRTYDLSIGNYLINETPCTNFQIETIRSNILIVENTTDVFPGTILENISFGSGREDEELARTCLNIVQLLDVIETLPNKLGTKLRPNFTGLSTGQLQRLGLARAIYRNPSFLILDETLSSMDTTLEDRILKNLRNYLPHIGCLIISHRQETASRCDKVIDFSKKEGIFNYDK